jgi:hypothetical protein
MVEKLFFFETWTRYPEASWLQFQDTETNFAPNALAAESRPTADSARSVGSVAATSASAGAIARAMRRMMPGPFYEPPETAYPHPET